MCSSLCVFRVCTVCTMVQQCNILRITLHTQNVALHLNVALFDHPIHSAGSIRMRNAVTCSPLALFSNNHNIKSFECNLWWWFFFRLPSSPNGISLEWFKSYREKYLINIHVNTIVWCTQREDFDLECHTYHYMRWTFNSPIMTIYRILTFSKFILDRLSF